jgi:hypothetical protein
MDERVRDFIVNGAQTLVGLDVALFYQANPRTFDTAAGVALRTHRDVASVEPALQRLAEQGILEAFTRGDGRYQVYALGSTPEAWNTLCLVSEAYHDDPESRKQIVRLLIERKMKERAGGAEPATAEESPSYE